MSIVCAEVAVGYIFRGWAGAQNVSTGSLGSACFGVGAWLGLHEWPKQKRVHHFPILPWLCIAVWLHTSQSPVQAFKHKQAHHVWRVSCHQCGPAWHVKKLLCMQDAMHSLYQVHSQLRQCCNGRQPCCAHASNNLQQRQ